MQLSGNGILYIRIEFCFIKGDYMRIELGNYSLFTNAYCGSAINTSSRFGSLTGEYHLNGKV